MLQLTFLSVLLQGHGENITKFLLPFNQKRILLMIINHILT